MDKVVVAFLQFRDVDGKEWRNDCIKFESISEAKAEKRRVEENMKGYCKEQKMFVRIAVILSE